MSEEDFCEGGALAHLQMELQLWAAYRGQLLSRTVRGALARQTLALLCLHPPSMTRQHMPHRMMSGQQTIRAPQTIRQAQSWRLLQHESCRSSRCKSLV